MEKKIINLVKNVLLFLFFSSNVIFYVQDNLIPNKEITRYALLVISSVLLVAAGLIEKNFRVQKTKRVPFFWLAWLGFSLSVILSSIISGELPRQGLLYLIFISFFYFIFVPQLFKNYDRVALIFMLSNFVYILWSFLTVSIVTNDYAYKGVFYNPNYLGLFALSTYIVSLYLLMNSLVNRDVKPAIIYVIITLLSILMILLSLSRTSFLGMIIYFLILIWYIFKDKKSSLLVNFTIILAVTALLFNYRDYFFHFIEKTRLMMQISDVSSGRFEIWMYIFRNARLFGGIIDELIIGIGKNSHNSILSILAGYGIIPMILYLVFCIICLAVTIKFFNNSKSITTLYPLTVFIIFMITGVTEGILGTVGIGVTPLFFILLGYTIKLENKRV